MGFSTTNLIITIGAFLFAFGILLFFINIALGIRNGRTAGPNPWDGPTLEWAVSSPPPIYNFAVIPLIASRHPLWEKRLGDTGEKSLFHEGFLLDRGKETLAVTPLDGEPDVILKMPGDSWLPFALSVALMPLFGGLLLHSVAITALGSLATLAILILWYAPQPDTAEDEAVRVYG